MRAAETIREVLQAMSVGFCGVKYDCLIWRVSPTIWSIGQSTLPTKPINPYTLEQTVRFICSVKGFIYDDPINLVR